MSLLSLLLLFYNLLIPFSVNGQTPPPSSSFRLNLGSLTRKRNNERSGKISSAIIAHSTKTKNCRIAEIICVKANFGIVVGKGILNNILTVLMGGGGAYRWRGV